MYLFDDGVNQVLELIHRSFFIVNLFLGVFFIVELDHEEFLNSPSPH